MKFKYTPKYLIVFTLITLIMTFIPNTTFAQGIPTISAPNGVLIDYETGQILFNKNAHEQTYPASTTKVMTAILVLENANLSDTVTIDYDLYVDGSSMYLLKGESFTVEELLHALLIRSANDAAEALAIHIAGSVEEFADMMNQRAKELGALNTNFTNPHGLPDSKHVTTAYDLAMIAKHAMKFDLFREIVSTNMLTFEPTEQTPETRYYRNTNRFLWGTGIGNQILYDGKYIDIKYDIIDGIKTGYTGDAGSCLISSGVRDDYRVISVVLGAEGIEVYKDSRTLIDYGHENFSLISLTNNNSESLVASILEGKQGSVDLSIANEKMYAISKYINSNDIKQNVLINENIEAPITKGQVLGKISYSLNGEILEEVDLIANSSIKKLSFIDKALKLSNIFTGVIILFVLWQVFVAYLRVKKKRLKRISFKRRSRRNSKYTFNPNLFK